MNRLTITHHDKLEHLGEQVFFVDPRDQGFGLAEHPFLDGYANKFLSLTESRGTFFSPRQVPEWLLDYYEQIGFIVADPNNTAVLPTASRIDSIRADNHANSGFAGHQDELLVPYMTTSPVEEIAKFYELRTLGAAATINAMADKSVFQQKLSELSADIARETGFDVAIPSATFRAGDRDQAVAAYHELSREATVDTIAVKPKSASALGIFVVRASGSVTGLETLLDNHFEDAEPVLLESFITHNHSPSMQGVVGRDGVYNHLYFGRQFVTMGADGHVGYDGNQTPFDFSSLRVSEYDLDRMQAVHQIVGDNLVAAQDIHGIAGVDSIVHIAPDGRILDFKLTELNLHLPGSISVYSTLRKLFPEGFEGIAHNTTIPLRSGQTAQSFFQAHRDRMITQPRTYGLFPINASYDDKIDIVALGKDAEHAELLLQGINS